MIVRRAALVVCLLLIPSFAWLGGYTYRQNITEKWYLTAYPIAVNDTFGINGNITWALIGNSSSAYSTGTELTGTIAIGNETSEKDWEDANTRTGNNPTNLWGDLALHFAEGTGSTTYDSSSNSADGTIDGATWTTGVFDNALDFDGDNDNVQTGTVTLDATFTISAWLALETNPAEQWGMIFLNDDDGSTTNWVNLFYDDDNDVTRIRCGVGTTGSDYSIDLDDVGWVHFVLRSDGSNCTMWINGTYKDDVVAGNPDDDGWTIMETGSSTYQGEGKVDEFLIYDDVKSDEWIQAMWRSGSNNLTFLEEQEPPSDIEFSFGPNYPLVNQVVTVTASWVVGNYTKFWWNWNDTSVINYTDVNFSTHEFNTSGSYDVVLIAYNADTTANATDTQAITIYAELSAANISITDHLPFLGAGGSQNFSFATTGGTPILNNSWAITLPNSSIFYYVNQSPLVFTPTAEGEHAIALTICDLNGGACASDSDSYRPWNVTGGVFLVEGFNVSESCLSGIFLGDSVTFSSGDQSLNWAMNGWSSVGTSASPTFSSAYAYWNDGSYYHFNVSLNASWGAYTSQTWFTVSAATYTLRAGACEAGETGYCWVLGGLYDEATFAEISDATTEWDFYSITSDYYGHEQEESVNATAADLNVTWCSNATPLLDHMLVDAMLTYSLENYTTRIYAWDNATFDFVGTCSYVNSHRYNFYTVSNATTTSVTFTVTQGGEALEDALLQIQAFHDSTWVTIASQLTDSSGQAQFDIHLCPTYYKFVVLGGGSILYSDKDCVESSPYTIEVGEDLDEFFSVWYDISTACSYDETDEYVACTISDPTGLTVVSTLNVTTALDYSKTAVCEVSEASGTTTLVCSVAGEPAGDYAWLLTITTSSGTYKINSGGFTIYGDIMEFEDKGIVAFATILILLLATRLPPEATIMISVGGFLAVRMMGLITTSYMAVGWVLALGVVGIMRVVKGG